MNETRLSRLEARYLARPELVVEVLPHENPAERIKEELLRSPLKQPRVKVLHMTTRRGDEIFTAQNFICDGAFYYNGK